MVQAADFPWSDVYQKLELLHAAAAIDPRHAELLFAIGKAFESLGRFEQAKEWFIRAKDEDICPLRILEPMHDIILNASKQHQIPLVDAHALFSSWSNDGIPGSEWLVDHIHPTITGHQRLADELFQAMATQNLTAAPSHWKEIRNPLWKKHLELLNDAYFEKGLQRLHRLQMWSRKISSSPIDSPQNPKSAP
jgi:tetratricopeptide (TPR) repeat protein